MTGNRYGQATPRRYAHLPPARQWWPQPADRKINSTPQSAVTESQDVGTTAAD
jgi:hypothetical protein